MNSEQSETFGDGFDESWERVHKNTEWGRYPPEELVRHVMRNFKQVTRSKRNKIKVLEIGCGQGANLWFLEREGFSAFGIDGSKTALNKAESWLNEENLYPNLSVMDACELGFQDNSFDYVIDVACIYSHLKSDIKSILSEIRRILEPGGGFFSTGLFDINTTGYGTGEKLEERTYRNVKEGVGKGGRGKVHYFTKDEINTLIRDYFSGVEIDRITRTEDSGEKTISFFLAKGHKFNSQT